MTLKNFLAAAFILALGIGFSSCGDDDDDDPTTKNLIVNLAGLQELGSGYVYEGWLIVDGNPVSTGVFTSVDFPQTITMESSVIDAATMYVLTIEPAGETGAAALAPAATKVLSGAFTASTATLSINDQIGDFSTSAGVYVLATPTDNLDNNESGIWWLDNSSGSPAPGLSLPDLTSNVGWTYEGWVVIDGTPLSTGTFDNPMGADQFSGFNGTDNPAPGFPGEDLLNNAPTGFTFPVDLRGGAAVISIEPVPDDSAAPFSLKPIVGMIADDAPLGTAITAGNNADATAITGTATR